MEVATTALKEKVNESTSVKKIADLFDRGGKRELANPKTGGLQINNVREAAERSGAKEKGLNIRVPGDDSGLELKRGISSGDSSLTGAKKQHPHDKRGLPSIVYYQEMRNQMKTAKAQQLRETTSPRATSGKSKYLTAEPKEVFTSRMRSVSHVNDVEPGSSASG